jgi:RecA-family ATPase
VLYLDFESYADIFAEHLSAIGTAPGWDFLDLKEVEPGETLIKQLESLTPSDKYDVIIIDPLMEAYPVRDENDNALASSQMLAFRKLARTTNAGVIVVHNSGLRKRQGPGRQVSRSRRHFTRRPCRRIDQFHFNRHNRSPPLRYKGSR